MPLGREFIRKRVDALLRVNEIAAAPVALYRLARGQGIGEIEFRPLLTDGGLDVLHDGFKVTINNPSYLRVVLKSGQSPEISLTRRQRFTLAHELGHTLFFDAGLGPPRRVKGAPRDDLLEYCCQYAARRILMPEDLLRARLRDRRVSSDLVLDLCSDFKVSAQVAVLRLDDLNDRQKWETAVVLGEFNQQYDDAVILAACSGLPLQAHIARPIPYTSLRRWCGRLLDSEFWQPANYERVVTTPSGGGLGFRKTPYPGQLARFFLDLDCSPRTAGVLEAAPAS